MDRRETTNFEVRKLRLLAKFGFSPTSVARIMNRSRGWVRYRMRVDHIEFVKYSHVNEVVHPAPDILYVVRLQRTMERLKCR